MTTDVADDLAIAAALPTTRGGAKALLLTVLGEFVRPAGGAAWTSTLVAAAGALDIGEKNARQAIARIGDQGVIRSDRHGRAVRWALTDAGRDLLETGARRIYSFGVEPVHWSGEWLVAHCPVAESQRAVRQRMRTRLGFLGFGELSPSLLVSPHVEREPEVLSTLADLDLLAESVVMRSTVLGDDADVVARAWDLDALAATYRRFVETHRHRRVRDGADSFRSVVELVHEWRRMPFVDPELPVDLLPDGWIGHVAATVFHERRAEWSPSARRWFAALDDA